MKDATYTKILCELKGVFGGYEARGFRFSTVRTNSSRSLLVVTPLLIKAFLLARIR